METGMPAVIARPRFDAEAYAEREAGRKVRSTRVAEVERLMRHADALSLDIYLEERAAYRQLVARCAHRGVPMPRKPKFYDVGKCEAAVEPVTRAAAPADPLKMRRVRRNFGDVLHVY